jgi:hypothetical protein
MRARSPGGTRRTAGPTSRNSTPGPACPSVAGWWLAPFFAIFLFCLFFQRPNRVRDSLFNVFLLLSYGFIYFSVAILVLEMRGYENGKDIVQIAMIGFFTMMPVILAGLVKLAKEYTRPPGEQAIGKESMEEGGAEE